MTKESKAQERWNKVRQIFKKVNHLKNTDPVDAVRVHVGDNPFEEEDKNALPYLQEASQNAVILEGERFNISKMTPTELAEHQLLYEDGTLKIKGAIADTSALSSKGEIGVQAFVMSKEGKLYMGKHTGLDGGISHGSFLDDKPIEMSGLISISAGQITKITDNSGHYKPQELDMYRGIKKLQTSMPEAFSPDCTITIFPNEATSINKFISKMEKVTGSKTRHEELRDQRLHKRDIYRQNLYTKYMLAEIDKNPIDVELIKDQISKGANINASNNTGKTILSSACEQNNKEMAVFLIEKGAYINQFDRNRQTPIDKAYAQDNKDIFKLLVAHDAHLNNQDKDAKTLLHLACEKKDKETIELLVSKGANLNFLDKDSKSPLHYAYEQGDKETVDLLIAHGANVNLQDKDGKTILHYAYKQGDKETVDSIIAHGENVNLQDKDGKTILHYAYERGDKETVDSIIAHGANVNLQDKDGKTILHYAYEQGDTETINLLKTKGANIDIQDINGKTAAHYACERSDKKTIDLLMSNGADIEIQDKQGKTPLLYACEKGDLEIAGPIIQAGNYLVNDKNDKSPLHYACEQRNLEIVILLADQIKKDDLGPLAYMEDKTQKTPLLYTKDIQIITRILSIPNADDLGSLEVRHIASCTSRIKSSNPVLFSELIGSITESQTSATKTAFIKEFSKKSINISEDIARNQAKKINMDGLAFQNTNMPSPIIQRKTASGKEISVRA